MKYVILQLLKDKPMHGYEVMKELEEHTRGCYKPYVEFSERRQLRISLNEPRR